QAIVERIEDREGLLAVKPEIAGPGFLNIRLAPDVWHKALRAVWDQRERFGRSDAGLGLRTMVEFVSANPTGPMHVGHGRGAVIGDTVASLLEWAGYDVFREFYVNDAGGQAWRLAHAVFARATAIDGSVPPEPLDPDDYQGEYVKDVSRAWLTTKPDLRKGFTELKEPLRKFATGWILDNLIKKDLESFGIRFDSFFSEKTLHDRSAIPHAVEVLRKKAAVSAMGGELEIILFQLVNLLKEGKPFKMSKRAANFVTLREVLEEAGSDATRFFFLLRRGDMALDFDVALARKHTLDNPVFYVQYGHARCAAILRKAKEERGLEPRFDLDALSALQLP